MNQNDSAGVIIFFNVLELVAGRLGGSVGSLENLLTVAQVVSSNVGEVTRPGTFSHVIPRSGGRLLHK